MFPTLCLLAGSTVAPTTDTVLTAKFTQPLVAPRLPDANGPDAIFLKYKIEAIPMGGWNDVRFVGAGDAEELKMKVEQLRKQLDERRQQQK